MKFTIFLISFLFTQLLYAQKSVQKIDSLLKSLYSAKKVNGSFLIAEKGKIIYQHSFGLANEITKEPLNENSIFELASCSKQFTAMAIMLLKEKGKLKLDDDFTKYLPELSTYKNITIRNLLNHTGGLPEYMQFMEPYVDKSKIATNEDMLKLFSKYTPAILFAPNTKYQYSNTGYALLALIIQRVSGISYGQFLDQYIFKPLQMKNTFVYNRRLHPKQVKNYALGYVYSADLKKYVLPDNLTETKMVVWLDGMVGDGAVNSTVLDLLKWDRALYSHKLISANGMKEIFEVATLNDMTRTKYGFGWGVDDNPDFGKVVRHTGGWPGYLSQIDRHISNDKTIIFLQNHDDAVNPVESIRNILYNKELPKETVQQEIKLPIEKLQQLVGTYEVQEGFEAMITLQGNQLYGQLTGQPAYALFAESEFTFFIKEADVKVQFERNEQGKISALYIIQSGNKTAAKKIN